MGLLDEKRARYEANREAGTLHRNPFAWLTDPAPPGTVATKPTSRLPWKGTPMDLTSKLEGHPIYSNAWQLGGGSLPNPDDINPALPIYEEMMSTPVQPPAQVPDPVPDEPLEEIQVKAKVYESSKAAQERGDPTPNVNALEPNAPVEAVTQANSLDLKTNTEQKAKANGTWSEKWQTAWDKFNEDVDLTTLGLSLMMNSGNGGSLTENLGIAMSQGIAAREAQIDKLSATERADRAEEREERKVAVQEQEANTALQKAIDTGNYQQGQLGIAQQGVAVDRDRAATAAAAQAEEAKRTEALNELNRARYNKTLAETDKIAASLAQADPAGDGLVSASDMFSTSHGQALGLEMLDSLGVNNTEEVLPLYIREYDSFIANARKAGVPVKPGQARDAALNSLKAQGRLDEGWW